MATAGKPLSGAVVSGAATATAFAATMVAMWSFSHERIGWGAYNLAIALLALTVVVAVRARQDG